MSRSRFVLFATLLLLAACIASTDAACRAKTDAPTPSPTPTQDDSVGGEGDDALTPAPKTKTPKPKKTRKPKATTAVPATRPASGDAGTAPLPSSNSTKTGGKCVTGDPDKYISKQYVDWIFEKRMKPFFDYCRVVLYDQLMTSNGKLSYCIRWDSPNKLEKSLASKFKAMLERQHAQWNKWLVGYGCWPFDKIEVEMVGVAVRDKSLLDWSDDSLGPIHVGILDNEGVPKCPDACYKHRDFESLADTSACKGKPFDVSFWPTNKLGGGTGTEWGQRVDEDHVRETIDADASVITAHEIGHTFGLPDFYNKTTDWPGDDLPPLIMVAGSSMTVTEGDGWLVRRGWEYVRNRWPATSG